MPPSTLSTAASRASVLELDLYANDVLGNSREAFARIREAGPVVWLPRHHTVWERVLGRDDVAALDQLYASVRRMTAGTGLSCSRSSRRRCLFVTGAVALLALVGSWWILGAAFAVHAATTAVVTYVVIHAMSRTPVAISRPNAQDVRDTSRRRGRQQGAALAAHR